MKNIFGAEAVADDERVVKLEHIDGIVAAVWHNIRLAIRGADDALLAALFDGIVQQFKNDVREVLVLERQLAMGGVGAFVLANRNLPLIEELLDGRLRACAIWQVQIVLASLEPIHLIIADAGQVAGRGTVLRVPLLSIPASHLPIERTCLLYTSDAADEL